MNTSFQSTTVQQLREVVSESIAIDAEAVQALIGRLVVSTSAEHPLAGPNSRSRNDLVTGTTFLLADRIPAGGEARALAEEIFRWHGRKAAETILGDRAAEHLFFVCAKGQNGPNQVVIPYGGVEYLLTGEDPRCLDGVPLLVAPDGTTFGPWDDVVDNPDARMSGGERNHWQMTARAVASYAIDDHPGDPVVTELVAAFNAVPDPQLIQRQSSSAPDSPTP